MSTDRRDFWRKQRTEAHEKIVDFCTQQNVLPSEVFAESEFVYDRMILNQSNFDIVKRELWNRFQYNVDFYVDNLDYGVKAIKYKLFVKSVSVLHTVVWKLTPIAEYIQSLEKQIKEKYPALDDQDISDKEFAQALENIQEACENYFWENVDSFPENYPKIIWSYFWDYAQDYLQHDGNGIHLSQSDLYPVLYDLGWVS